MSLYYWRMTWTLYDVPWLEGISLNKCRQSIKGIQVTSNRAKRS